MANCPKSAVNRSGRRYKTNTINLCQLLKLPDSIVIRANADIAPLNTIRRGCRIAIMAAMKNVLSPNSDTTITDKDAINACKKLKSVNDLLVFPFTLLSLSAVLIVSAARFNCFYK